MRLASTRTLRREIDEAVIAGKPIGAIDAVRLVRRVWDYIGEAHARARPMQPEPVTPLPRRTRPPRRPVPERRTARSRIAA